MYPIKSEFDWPKLRRNLEEILAIIAADQTHAPFNQSVDESALLPIPQNEATCAEPHTALDKRPEPEPRWPLELTKNNQPDKTNDLYDNAIVVLTEFGQASPAILQMWLSIDYSNAMKIMNRLQTEGLISSKGRVRHKAFSLRRSLNPQPQ